MEKFIHKFSLFLGLITFVTCVFSNISLFTSLVRSVEVYLGIIFIFFIGGHLLRIGVAIMAEKPPEPEEDIE